MVFSDNKANTFTISFLSKEKEFIMKKYLHIVLSPRNELVSVLVRYFKCSSPQ